MGERGAVLVIDFTGRKCPEDAIELGPHAWLVPGTEEALRQVSDRLKREKK